jgi:hypothetical protein
VTQLAAHIPLHAFHRRNRWLLAQSVAPAHIRLVKGGSLKRAAHIPQVYDIYFFLFIKNINDLSLI